MKKLLLGCMALVMLLTGCSLGNKEADIKTQLKAAMELVNTDSGKAYHPESLKFLKTSLFDFRESVVEKMNKESKVEKLKVAKIESVSDKNSCKIADVAYSVGDKSFRENIVFKKDGNNWRICTAGIVESTPLKMTADIPGIKVAGNWCKDVYGEYTLVLMMSNQTKRGYKLGWARPAQFILFTDKEEKSPTATKFLSVEKYSVDLGNGYGKDVKYMVIPYGKLAGVPQKLLVKDVNRLNDSGLPEFNVSKEMEISIGK